MKKILIISVLLLLTIFGISAQELVLDEAITQAAREIEGELPQRAMVLVLNLASPSAKFSDYVLEELTDKLVMRRVLTVVDRQNLRAIREEMNFQYSGEVSDESMLSIGKMLGAHYIVTGSLTDRGTAYRLRFRIIFVETARILSSVIIDLKKDAQVAYLMGDVSAQQEMEREQKRIDRINRDNAKTANVKNNWLSAELFSGFNTTVPIFSWDGNFSFGIGLQYERMLGAKISLGANLNCGLPIRMFYAFTYMNSPVFGIDTFFRWYPSGKKFFTGIGLGYYFGGNFEEIFSSYVGDPEIRYSQSNTNGFTITPEFGWKIDVGKEGGFFIQLGGMGTIIFGSMQIDSRELREEPFVSSKKEFITFYPRIYIGAGVAF